MTLTTPVYPSTSVLARYCAEMVPHSEVWPDINDKDVYAYDREMDREEPEAEVTLSPSDERTLTHIAFPRNHLVSPLPPSLGLRAQLVALLDGHLHTAIPSHVPRRASFNPLDGSMLATESIISYHHRVFGR